RFALLRGGQYDVAASGKGHAIGGVTAEEILPAVREAVRFRAIHRHPGFARHQEESPAMIPAEGFGTALFVRQVQADLEAAGHARSAAEGVEKGMEVGAVPFADFACVTRAAESPA